MTRTGNPLKVYTLDDLPPEVVAVTFAKTSRVPDSFDAIARELTETDSSRFHEKWVIGYGHSSVSEHAVLSIAIENVSILGAKFVEENRLSSFTEKSTRYQVMDPGNYYTPPSFTSGSVGNVYRRSMAGLYETYGALMPEAKRFCEEKYGGSEWEALGVSPAGKACDAIRGLLPAAAKTNLGWTVNARSLRHALVKMASSRLEEMRELAVALQEIGERRVPTLLKYTEGSPYLTGWEDRLATSAATVLVAPVAQDTGTGVRLVDHDPDGERAVLAAVLFRATNRPYEEIRSQLSGIGRERIGVLLKEALQRIGGHEAPVREFESTAYTFEITCDFGAYRDIQRHRMTMQTQQPLTCEHGYAVTDDAREAGLAGRVEESLCEAHEACLDLAGVDPVHAQYAVPLAFNKRFLMRMNFREAYQFVRLRSRIQGHQSYRRVARAVKEEIERVHPGLGDVIPVEHAPAAPSRELHPASSG